MLIPPPNRSSAKLIKYGCALSSMVRRVKQSIRAKCQNQFRSFIRELRQQLSDINQKIDHLIKHYRKYYIT